MCRDKNIIYIGYNKNPEEENKRMPRPLYASTFFMDSRTDKNSDLFAYHVAKCNFKRIKCLIAGEVKGKVEGQNDFIELKAPQSTILRRIHIKDGSKHTFWVTRVFRMDYVLATSLRM